MSIYYGVCPLFNGLIAKLAVKIYNLQQRKMFVDDNNKDSFPLNMGEFLTRKIELKWEYQWCRLKKKFKKKGLLQLVFI